MINRSGEAADHHDRHDRSAGENDDNPQQVGVLRLFDQIVEIVHDDDRIDITAPDAVFVKRNRHVIRLQMLLEQRFPERRLRMVNPPVFKLRKRQADVFLLRTGDDAVLQIQQRYLRHAAMLPHAHGQRSLDSLIRRSRQKLLDFQHVADIFNRFDMLNDLLKQFVLAPLKDGV